MNGNELSMIGLCVVLAGCLTWICKHLLKILTNDLECIKKGIADLPCRRISEQVSRLEGEINQLKRGER